MFFSSASPTFATRIINARPISHEQLVIEVKGIYAGLVMVDSIRERRVRVRQLWVVTPIIIVDYNNMAFALFKYG